MKKVIFSNSSGLKDWGLFLIRIGVGAIFIKHGYAKMIGGTETWSWLGAQMANIGIQFIPTFWGFLAACTEFFGGIALVLGLFTRLASLLLAFVMFVAFMMHYSQGDAFGIASHPLALCFVFVGLMFAGGGSFSFDRFFLGGQSRESEY